MVKVIVIIYDYGYHIGNIVDLGEMSKEMFDRLKNATGSQGPIRYISEPVGSDACGG